MIASTYTSSVTTADGRGGGELRAKGGMSMGLCVLKVFHIGYAPCAAPLTSVQMADIHECVGLSRLLSSMYALSCSCLGRDENLVSGVRECASPTGTKLGESVEWCLSLARNLNTISYQYVGMGLSVSHA